jgi:hypothetical protein
MLTIDSVKLQFPADCLHGFRSDGYTCETNSRGKNQYIFDNKAPGLKGAKVDMSQQHVTLELSAKILADQYMQGISLTTIEQAVTRALSISGLDADPGEVIGAARVLSMDTTRNLWVPDDMNRATNMEVIDSLHAAKYNQRFNAIPYRAAQNMGLVYQGLQKAKKNRLIFYYKPIEMGRHNKANREFFATCTNPGKVYADMQNKLRCEQNHTDFASIRERLKVSTNSLMHVLCSDARPNFDMFLKVIGPDPAPVLSLFNEYPPDKYTWKEVLEMEGLKHILNIVQGDQQLLRAMVKRYHRTESAFTAAWSGRIIKGMKGRQGGLSKLLQQAKAKELEGRPLQIIESIKQQLSA